MFPLQKKIRKRIAKNLILSLCLSLSSVGLGSALSADYAQASGVSAVKTVNVDEITYSGNSRMSSKEIAWLLPELKKGEVNVERLSRQIQLANDTGAVNLAVNFVMDKQQNATAVVTVKEQTTNHMFLGVDNTGNKETGDFRTSLTYINTDAGNKADTFAISYVGSPDHFDSVKQAALFYRMLLPSATDSMYVVFTHSDVDMGRVATIGSMGIDANGNGNSVGVHYQKNLEYQPSHRSFLDFGLDYSKYNNETPVSLDGVEVADIGTGPVSMMMLGLSYNDSIRVKNSVFGYNVGYSGNIGGDQSDFDRQYKDRRFGIGKYGLYYQHKYDNGWIANVKVTGQYSNKSLVSQAKLGAGGVYTVRGFNETAIQADSGVLGSVEFYTPEIAAGQRMVVFADCAQLSNNSADDVFSSARLASVGLGWRYSNQDNGWSGRVDYGHVVSGKSYNLDHDSGRLHVIVSKRL